MPDGRKLRHREHPFFSGSPPASLQDRLNGLRFTLDEEADVTFVEALHRVREALDVSPELNLFAKRPWYAERSDDLAVAMARGDPGAFDAFVLLHRPLARHIGKRLQRRYGLDPDDAEQIGVLGLMEAARRFNPERGYQFSTYATYWIRKVCDRLGPDAALPIRLPAHIIQSFFPLLRRLEALASRFGPGRVNDELARLSLEHPGAYRRWLAFQKALNVRSLSDRHESEYYEARAIPIPLNDSLIEEEDRAELTERIQVAMTFLDSRQKRLLRLRYGMDGEVRTLEQIGRAEGITRERVRQIVVAAEKRLRHFVQREMPDLIPPNGVTVAPAVPSEVKQEASIYTPLDPSVQEAISLIESLVSSSVSILSQKELKLCELDLKDEQEPAEHVADAICR
jgi:RNA polymerase sigma factor (sigma-70 family)